MTLERPRILLADDELQFRKVAARLLERDGYEIETVGDASAALLRLSEQIFDLLIADVHMPGNDGLAVLSGQAKVPVLVVTGDPSVQTAVEALRGSAVDYMTKPLSPERFLKRVAEGVARGQALRRLDDAEQRLNDQLELVAGLRASLQVAGGSRAGERAPLPAVIAADLSPREREVLCAFRDTPRPAEVAAQLHISPHTVKNHLKAIYRKLGVSSQAELLARLSEGERSGS